MTSSIPQEGRKALREMAYKSTPIFSQRNLPKGLRNAHATKSGVWGVLEVLSGQLIYVIEASENYPEKRRAMARGDIQIIESELQHHVEPSDAMHMQVHFFDHRPKIDESGMI